MAFFIPKKCKILYVDFCEGVLTLKKNKFLWILALALCSVFVLSGCSKNKDKESDLPSAESLITTNFAKSLASGHYSQTIKSTEMKQSSRDNGYFKGTNPISMTYSLTSKGKTQGEQIWLTDSELYLLLEQNKGKWIKNKSTADNFDPEQVTRRFKPSTYTSLNKAIAKHAIVKQSSTNYTVTYAGSDSSVWNKLNSVIVDTLNTPGSQNMNVAQMVSAAQVQNVRIIYTVNKSSKMITKIDMKANFTVGGRYNFAWTTKFDELNTHNDLTVPANIQKDAIDVQKIKASQKSN